MVNLLSMGLYRAGRSRRGLLRVGGLAVVVVLLLLLREAVREKGDFWQGREIGEFGDV
jgi:hypothetical protein